MNPVRLKNKSLLWILALCSLIVLFLLSIVTTVATPSTPSSCTVYKVILVSEPICIFLYYRLYSRLLLKIMDALTCKCSQHGVGYAILHYVIWSTIGHPWVCFSLFYLLNIQQTLDILGEGTCTSLVTDSIQVAVWNTCFTTATLIFIIIIIPAGVVVSYKNHKDVKFHFNWKERDAKQKEEAIDNAIRRTMTHNNNKSMTVIAEERPIDIQLQGFGDIKLETDENEAEDIGNEPPLNHQSTQDQIQAALAASMVTAQAEEEKRRKGKNKLPQNGPNPLSRQRSPSMPSMSAFWAKGQRISTNYLGGLFQDNQFECVVCYETYKVGDVLAELKCGHQMHRDCAKDWLKANPTCPFCRVNVLRE